MVAAFRSFVIELSQLGVITRARAGMLPARMASTSKSLPKPIHLKPSLAMMLIQDSRIQFITLGTAFQMFLITLRKCNSKGLGVPVQTHALKSRGVKNVKPTA